MPFNTKGVLIIKLFTLMPPSIRTTSFILNDELLSKITLSVFEGISAPGSPPEVNDQCVLSFQFPVPFTQ